MISSEFVFSSPIILQQVRKWLEEFIQDILILEWTLVLDSKGFAISIAFAVGEPAEPIRLNLRKKVSFPPTNTSLGEETKQLVSILKNAFRLAYSNKFYQSNYEVLFEQSLAPASTTNDIILRDVLLACRFCQDNTPTAFTQKAHAIPELLGNKILFSKYECDNCNSYFGNTFERELGNWFREERLFFAIEGKKGLPWIDLNDSLSCIENAGGNNLNFRVYEGSNICIVDHAKKTLKITVPSCPFVPSSVMKAFFKMAVTVIPEQYAAEYKEFSTWLRDESKSLNDKICFKLLKQFFGETAFKSPRCILLRRKNHDKKVPYMTFVLCVSNYSFQVWLPSVYSGENGHSIRSESGQLHKPQSETFCEPAIAANQFAIFQMRVIGPLCQRVFF
jgi:hypothetical protein